MLLDISLIVLFQRASVSTTESVRSPDHAYACAQYFAISDQRGVASNTIIFDPNLYVIVLSFAKLQ